MNSEPRKNHPADIMKNKVFDESDNLLNQLNNNYNTFDKKLLLWNYVSYFIKFSYQKGYNKGYETGLIRGYNKSLKEKAGTHQR